ncbi:ABC transporter ATP-binding protein [Blastococcus sp. Marseille-P5729]|uniref:ABC transporter ATP-binding protein n=1 Tax=Blastococcus sp. Marseille-P5729 TaxID=2086582 RepID=UPI000D10CD16|nr:ABC transporter ATP-binding protein [Blastococcus sp. Marseille-P5729]
MSAPTPPADTRCSKRRVLTVENLCVDTANFRLLDGVTFSIDGDERVGLIGESGSGKSVTSLAIIGLLAENLSASGRVVLNDVDLMALREKQLAAHRGKDVAMVFQEPMTALNPSMKIGRQIAETMLIHDTQPSKKTAMREAVKLLEQVGLPDPEQSAEKYPHQLSGGQRQRVVIAIALANDPSLLICDEPTTALDVTVQAQVLDLIREEADLHDSALLFITHDLAVVAMMCHRVLVMYGGCVVEAGTVHEVFESPRHPYTAGLLASSDLDEVDEEGNLQAIPGSVPPAGRFPDGCVFRNRCPNATDECTVVPPWTTRDGQPVDAVSGNSGYACYHPIEMPR